MRKSKKVMRVARGTERAARREGLHQGWRVHGRGPAMKPAKHAVKDLLAQSTHGVTWSPQTAKAMEDAIAKRAEEGLPRRQKFAEEPSGKVMNKKWAT